MRKRSLLPALVLLAVCAFARTAATARAKGPIDIVLGGSDLAPYWYAIPDVTPVEGWLGLLETTASGPPQPLAAPPADAPALLASAYDLYFEYDIATSRTPSARYVPANAAHTAYLYYQQPGDALAVGWYALSETSAQYLDRERVAALLFKAAGSPRLETDPIDALVRHGRYFTGAVGTPSIWATRLVLRDTAGATPDTAFTGTDAARLLDAYVATLHNWHEIPPGQPCCRYEVRTDAAREVFFFDPGSDGAPARVFAAEGYNGYFDPAPILESMMLQALDLPSPQRAEAAPATHPGRTRDIAAGVTVVAIFAALALIAASATLLRRRTA
jgi:hypothetical protein